MFQQNKFLDRFACGIEWLSEWSGRLVAWLVLAMVLLVTYDVVMRYLFQAGSVALQELEWHLFALIFLLGAAYTLKHDDHVRVDIFYSAKWMTVKRKAWLNLICTLLFLQPFCFLIIINSWPFVYNAWDIGEGSPDPGGLPFRFILKAAIPIGFILLALQGLALMIRCAQTLSDIEGKENHQSEQS